MPVAEIVSSLLALERVIKRTPQLVEAHYKGIDIISCDVYVETIEAGSLVKDLMIKLVFKKKDQYEAFEKLINQVLEESDVIRLLIAFGVGSAVGIGLMTASSSEQPRIENYGDNVVVFAAGNNLNVSKDDVKRAMKASPKQLAKDAVDIIKPAKRDPKAQIEIKGMEELTILPDVVAEAPENYEAPKPSEKTESYDNITLLVSASDKDNHAQGWAGIAPDIVDTRTKVVLDDGIDPKLVHGRTKLKANIIVTSKYITSKKSYKAAEIYVSQIH